MFGLPDWIWSNPSHSFHCLLRYKEIGSKLVHLAPILGHTCCTLSWYSHDLQLRPRGPSGNCFLQTMFHSDSCPSPPRQCRYWTTKMSIERDFFLYFFFNARYQKTCVIPRSVLTDGFSRLQRQQQSQTPSLNLERSAVDTHCHQESTC